MEFVTLLVSIVTDQVPKTVSLAQKDLTYTKTNVSLHVGLDTGVMKKPELVTLVTKLVPHVLLEKTTNVKLVTLLST